MKNKQEQNIEGLSEAETLLVRNAALGYETLLKSEDQVRSTVIRALITRVKFSEKHELWDIHPSGLQIKGGNVTGLLDFDNCDIDVPLTFLGVNFHNTISLMEANTKRITLNDECKIFYIFATNAVVEGTFNVANTTSSGGLIFSGMSCRSMSLNKTKIAGSVNLNGLRMEGSFSAEEIIIKNLEDEDVALNANGLECRDVFLNESNITGKSTFISAKIVDQFNANKAKFTNKNNEALNCQGLNCVDIYLSQTLINGECSFSGAEITGQFGAVDTTFNNPDGDALNIQQLRSRALFLKNSKFLGICDFKAATIDGPIDADEAHFTVEHGKEAIKAGMLSCLRLMLNKAVVIGTVNLEQATIKHNFCANKASFKITDDIHLQDSAEKSNERPACLNLSHANLTVMDLAGVKIDAFNQIAIQGKGMNVDSLIHIRENTDIIGDVCFAMLSVSGELAIDDSKLNSNLDLHEAKLGKLRLPKQENSLQGIVDLSRAKVGTFCDFKASWPIKKMNVQNSTEKAYLKLDGFEYDFLENPSGDELNGFGEAKTDIFENRIEWLNRQVKADLDTNFRPQPWYQLAKVLNASGYEDDARKISIERRVALRNCGKTTRFQKFISWFLHKVADYGFNPWKTLGWSIFVVVVCSIFYYASSSLCSIQAPLCSDDKVFVRILGSDLSGLQGIGGNEQNFLRETYPSFNPLLYSLDVFLPLLDLGTEPYWRPNEHFVIEVKSLPIKEFELGLLLQVLTICEQMFGAILISLMVTGFTGMLTRDEK